MLSITSRELRSLLGSPMAWCVLALIQFILGVFFFLRLLIVFVQQQPALVLNNSSVGITALVVSPLLNSSVLVLLILTPLLSMRLISEERRNGSFTLLQSAPQSLAAIVLGKFLALLVFLLLTLALVALLPLSLLMGGSIDIGLTLSCLLGLLLSTISFAAVGLAVSTMTVQPSMAALLSMLVLLGFWSLDPSSMTPAASAASNALGLQAIMQWLALRTHLTPMMHGLVQIADVAYFIILTLLWLCLAAWRLESIRLNG